MKINLAIIGLGIIAERMIPVFKAHGEFKIRGGYDIDACRNLEISSQHGFKAFDSVASIIEDSSIDAVYLAVPPKYHFDFAMQIIQAGKHLICEKPLANSIEAAEKMCDAAMKTPVIVAMNFPMPYTHAFLEMKRLVENKTLGKLVRVEISGRFPQWPRKWQDNRWIDSRDQGGFTREVFTHMVQLAVDLFGPITLVANQVTYPENSKLSEIGLLAFGKTQKGIDINFDGLAGVSQPETLSFTVYGEKGIAEIFNWRTLYMTSELSGKVEQSLVAVKASDVLVDEFYKAIVTGNGELVDFRSGFETTKVIEGLLKTI